ncbi:hypothetical protein A9G29_01250 [Gilliamella sp. Fer2-1]|jgi:hypothetical protein|nr:hypothetical protein A9G29_01250 [Gilliamella apicola]
MLNHDDAGIATKTATVSQTSLVTFCSILSISLPIGIFSLLLTIIALFFALITSGMINSSLLSTVFYFLAFIMGIVGIYYALRIKFDKKLFDYLATSNECLINTLIDLDNALMDFHLIKSKPLVTRTITERQQGTLKLFKQQIIMLVIQIMLLIGAWISGLIQLC